MSSVLSDLVDQGYGCFISEYSELLGSGLWKIEADQAGVSIFKNGFRHKSEETIEISYSDIVGIKSSLTIDTISKAQSEEIRTLVMRFECGANAYNLDFPLVIYSSLLGYFCDQVKQSQRREVVTGFVSDR